MGLFDGASGRGELASTAQVAKLLHAPVVLVVDGSAMARSAAAIVHGFATFDPQVEVAGVIFNRVGSDIHEQLLREAVEPLGLPVLGALRRDERIAAPERHLGLVPVAEREPRTRTALDLLAATLAERVDLEALLALARSAPSLAGEAWSPHPRAVAATHDDGQTGANARDRGAVARIAIARGPAFSFHYQENLELLEAAGAELLPFDPLREEMLPQGTDALVLAGGFPEVFGAELAANARLRGEVAAHAAAGRPILAECGGLLFLCEHLDGHEMCGVVPMRAAMGRRLTLGYREATAATTTPWLAPANAPARPRVPPHAGGRRNHGACLDARRARARAPGGLRRRRGPGELSARALGRLPARRARLRRRGRGRGVAGERMPASPPEERGVTVTLLLGGVAVGQERTRRGSSPRRAGCLSRTSQRPTAPTRRSRIASPRTSRGGRLSGRPSRPATSSPPPSLTTPSLTLPVPTPPFPASLAASSPVAFCSTGSARGSPPRCTARERSTSRATNVSRLCVSGSRARSSGSHRRPARCPPAAAPRFSSRSRPARASFRPTAAHASGSTCSAARPSGSPPRLTASS